jgi:hypothetical protein
MEKSEARLFNVWKGRIDSLLESSIGLTTNDLADEPYKDWFDEGMSAMEVVELIAEEEGFDLE